jgi:hypothetical protein
VPGCKSRSAERILIQHRLNCSAVAQVASIFRLVRHDRPHTKFAYKNTQSINRRKLSAHNNLATAMLTQIDSVILRHDALVWAVAELTALGGGRESGSGG